MTLTETRAILALLAAAYNRDLPATTAEIWAAALTDTDPNDAQTAALDLIKTSPYLPKAADLRDRARAIRDQRHRHDRHRHHLAARTTPPPTTTHTGAAMIRHVLRRLAEAGQDTPNGAHLGRDRATAIAHTAIEEWRQQHPTHNDT